MSAADQAPISPGQPNVKPNILHVVLLSFKDGVRNSDGDNYAVIKFPETYEDAVSSVTRVLGHRLQHAAAHGFGVLCPMLNNKAEWIWGEANSDDWDIIVEEALRTGKALGFRERNAFHRKEVAWSTAFVQGPVYLTFGSLSAYGLTTWTNIDMKEGCIIDRPLSYMDAITAVKAAAQHPKSPFKDSLTGKNLTKFKFHYFTSTLVGSGKATTDFSVNFPAGAYTDDKMWLASLPKAHQILGFTFH